MWKTNSLIWGKRHSNTISQLLSKWNVRDFPFSFIVACQCSILYYLIKKISNSYSSIRVLSIIGFGLETEDKIKCEYNRLLSNNSRVGLSYSILLHLQFK